MSKVIGRKRNVSGNTTPKDCLNKTPSKIANPAINPLPKIQFEKRGLSSEARKYGKTATINRVRNRKALSILKTEIVRPNSIARKKRMNDVSMVDPLSAFAMRDAIFINFL